MQKHVVDSTAGGLSSADIENHHNEVAEGDGRSEAASVSQSKDLVEKIVDVVVVNSAAGKGESLNKSDSRGRVECRVCQEDKEEGLIDLGCHCRGALAKAHRTCIIRWFQTRGSNKCEICQQIASNVTPPDSQTNYWIWRVDPGYTSEEHQRRSFKFIWVALLILIGGLVLDVLISITFGVSALPTNIIIGVIVVLGLVTSLRLGLEFYREWHIRRGLQRSEASAGIDYLPHAAL